MPTADAQRKATAKYQQEHYEQIAIRVPKGLKDEWKAAAEKSGKSLAQFIADGVALLIERECL